MIRTQRLLLRHARTDDLDDLHAVLSNPDAMRYWDRPAYEDIQTTRRFLDGLIHQDPNHSFDLVVECGGHCIGKVGMWRLPEIGYILHPAYWGQGLATEALSALLSELFTRFPDQSVFCAECDPRNAASVRLLTKLGFRKTREEKANFLYGETEWCDTAYFELERV